MPRLRQRGLRCADSGERGWALFLLVWADPGVQLCSPLLAEPSTRQPGKPGLSPAHVVIWARPGWGLCCSSRVSSENPSPPGQQRGSRGALPAPCHGAQAAGSEMGLLIAPLSCSPSSLQEGATLVHAAVLGNQVIPRVGRRHLPLPVSTACGLCSPLPLVLRAGGVSPQLGSGEGRASARLSWTPAGSCPLPSGG